MNTEFKKQIELYLNDPMFHQLVDMMVNWIRQSEVTVLDLRLACNFAINKFYMENSAETIIATRQEYERRMMTKEMEELNNG